MTTETWPSGLNHYAERGSFKFTQNEQQLRSDFDRGPARMRQRFTSQVARAEFAVLMDDEDFELFKAFWAHKINHGTSWFNMPVWSGSEYVVSAVRFTEPYTAADGPFRHMRISAKLEQRQLAVWSEDTFDLVAAYGGDNLTEWSDFLQVIVNEQYPQMMEDYRP